MPSARQTAALARSTAQVHADHAGPVRIGGTTGTGIYPAPRFERELAEGGFKVGHDAILRLIKADWPALTSVALVEASRPELYLSGAWVQFKVKEVTDVANSGEWRIGLEHLR